jgi:hypothetical protein
MLKRPMGDNEIVFLDSRKKVDKIPVNSTSKISLGNGTSTTAVQAHNASSTGQKLNTGEVS